MQHRQVCASREVPLIAWAEFVHIFAVWPPAAPRCVVMNRAGYEPCKCPGVMLLAWQHQDNMYKVNFFHYLLNLILEALLQREEPALPQLTCVHDGDALTREQPDSLGCAGVGARFLLACHRAPATQQRLPSWVICRDLNARHALQPPCTVSPLKLLWTVHTNSHVASRDVARRRSGSSLNPPCKVST